MNWYLKALNNYATFQGRARRKEYWYFYLFCIIISIVALIADNTIGLLIGEGPFGYLTAAFLLAMVVPYLSVTVRRLHDTGKSGWYWFVQLIPSIGGIVMLIFMVLDSDQGDNQFGPDPKAEERGGLSLLNV